jgi:hypothetical protein
LTACNRDGFDYRVDVAVQRKVEPTAGNLDALLELVEEIALAGFRPETGDRSERHRENTMTVLAPASSQLTHA